MRKKMSYDVIMNFSGGINLDKTIIMKKCVRGSWRVIICFSLCFLLSLAHQLLQRLTFERKTLPRRVINYKITFRNRNVAAYDESISNANPTRSVGFEAADVDVNNRNLFYAFNNIFNRLPSLTGKEPQRPDQITIDDIFISVKTSRKFHDSRLKIIIDTWFQLAKQQTFFFTDADDENLNVVTGNHMINTHCNSSHTRHDLSCKMSAEYDGFMDSDKKWWCHFDDDNYVNINQLVALLRRYNWNDDVYLGKSSLGHPFYVTFKKKKEKIWFATGGAGICISRSLGRKMTPWSRNGELLRTSDLLRIPDDCTVGFVVSNRLGVNLTTSSLLHSHLENLKYIDVSTMPKQVTLSYHLNEDNSKKNVINIPKSIPLSSQDPTNILSLHCHLYPTARVCR